MKDASAGVGRIVYTRKNEAVADAMRGNSTVNPATFIPDPTGDQVDQFVDNGGRRVPASGHVAQPWDPAGGTDPHRFEHEDVSLGEGLSDQEWLEEGEEESSDAEERTD